MEEILKPLVDKWYMLKETYDFFNKIRFIEHKLDRILVSFDVEHCLETVETIDLFIELILKDNYTTYHDLTKQRDLLKVCTSESHFQFGGVYYDQIDGVAMSYL